MKWYQISIDEVIAGLGTSTRGLSTNEVNLRRERYGKNIVTQDAGPSLVQVIARQFQSPIIYILCVAAVLACVGGKLGDALIIMMVVTINSIIGSYQEWHAEKSSRGLQKILTIKARVLRDGYEQELDAQDLVPGDYVILEHGMAVPADIRIVRSENCSVNESVLTGESRAVDKRDTVIDADVSLFDRCNMLFAGTVVVRGRAQGLVVATGMMTEFGTIAHLVSDDEAQQTSLMIRLERLGNMITTVVIGACLSVLGIGYLVGIGLLDMIVVAISLLVAAIPEGLPIAVTIALSVGSRRMAARNVIVKRLSAVEAFGSCSCIATDKTGTLTMNQQKIVAAVLPSGKMVDVTTTIDKGNVSLKKIAIIGSLCNQSYQTHEAGSWRHQGDEVDIAFKVFADDVGISDDVEHLKMVKFFPFETDRAAAAVLYQKGGDVYVGIKGAFENILELCSRGPAGQDHEDWSASRARMLDASTNLMQRGCKVLALAYAPVKSLIMPESWHDIIRIPMEMVGVVGLEDPLRSEVRWVLNKARRAGVRVVMVTGDHEETAFAIARQAGITDDRNLVVNGSSLEKILDNRDLMDKTVHQALVFARVTPLQKVAIVEALKRNHHFVAVTGDGVNDTAALKAAHLGIAMGSGSDCAQQGADAVIVDDNFASIVNGIEEGRIVYRNIRRVLLVLVAAAVAEIMFMAIILMVDGRIPLLPVQLVWLNLIAHGIQDVSLAAEPGEAGILDHPWYRPEDNILDKYLMALILLTGLCMALIASSVWTIGARVLMYDIVTLRNSIFLLFMFMFNAHIVTARSGLGVATLASWWGNGLVMSSVILSQLIHIVCMHLPYTQRLLHIAPVGMQQWGILLASACMIVPAVYVFRYYVKTTPADRVG